MAKSLGTFIFEPLLSGAKVSYNQVIFQNLRPDLHYDTNITTNSAKVLTQTDNFCRQKSQTAEGKYLCSPIRRLTVAFICKSLRLFTNERIFFVFK